MQELHTFKPESDEHSSLIDYVDMDLDLKDQFNIERGEIMYATNLQMWYAVNGMDRSAQSIAFHLNTGVAMAKHFDLPLPQRKEEMNADESELEGHAAA